MVHTLLLLLMYIVVPALLMYGHTRFRFCRKVGSIIMAYAIGIIISFTGLSSSVNPETDRYISIMQNVLQNICVPMAIPLMLFSSNFKSISGKWKQLAIAFFAGVIAVSISVFTMFTIFKQYSIPELDKAAGLMMGFYTGGTPNVASLNMALKPSSETFLLVNSFEIVITFFLLAFLVGGGYKLIRKALPYNPSDSMEGDSLSVASPVASPANSRIARKNLARASSIENYEFILNRRIRRTWVLSLGMTLLIAAVSALLSLFFVESYRVVVVILSITTLSIVASFWDKLRKAPKTFEMGMYFILVFSLLIASNFSIEKIGSGTEKLFLFIVFVLLGSVSLHFLLAKLFKIESDTFTISMVALIFSPPFVPTVAGAMNNRSCVLTGIIIGLLGYAVGNYVGIGMYILCGL